MQKNNSTVKNVSRNALQVIIQELSLSDANKAKMYEDLRNMGITDDNDPLVKFTMLQGLFAKYTGDMIDDLIQEREYIEEAISTNKDITDRFSSNLTELRNEDFPELKNNIKIWKHESITEKEKIIAKLRNDEIMLLGKISKEKNELCKIKDEQNKIREKFYWFIGICVVVLWVIAFILMLIYLPKK